MGRRELERKEGSTVGRYRAWPSERCLSLMPVSSTVEPFPHSCCECPLPKVDRPSVGPE